MGGLDFLCTSLNSSQSFVLLRSPPAELGGRDGDILLGLPSLSLKPLACVASNDILERAGLGSLNPRLRLRAGSLEPMSVVSGPGATEDCVRVGLGARLGELEYLGREALALERGLLERRLAIPDRAPKAREDAGNGAGR